MSFSMNPQEWLGDIIAVHGRHYAVELDDGQIFQAFPRGKRSELAVGDRVHVQQTANDQVVITQSVARKNLLYRSDAYKSKLLAANVDLLLIVVATEPSFSDDLLGRALTAAEALKIEVLIILNKIDLEAQLNVARERLKPLQNVGYSVVELSANSNADHVCSVLNPRLAGRRSLLIGQSGMGKSTLLNVLIPEAQAQTREISTHLDSGKHTTTFTRRYRLNCNEKSYLIDSPGFQVFGLFHLSQTELAQAFREFRPYFGTCKFYNCTHRHEPGCNILAAVDSGLIHARRHRLYMDLFHEGEQQGPYR
jgi:ribosome biogenesis GTPase / thiamine phosphate phosphatase